jgi:hypothetical protein
MAFLTLRYQNVSNIDVSEGGMVLPPQKARKKEFILRLTIDDKTKADSFISQDLKLVGKRTIFI